MTNFYFEELCSLMISDKHAERRILKQIIISNVEASRLREVSVKHVIEFAKPSWNIRGRNMTKGKQTRTEIPTTSIKALEKDADRKTVVAAGLIRADTIEQMTKNPVISCFKQRSLRHENGEKLYLVDEMSKGLIMKIPIFEAHDRIWTLERQYSSALEAAGYGSCTQDKVYKVMQHDLAMLQPHSLSYDTISPIVTNSQLARSVSAD